MRRAKDGVRLLGNGELKAKVTFRGVRRLEVGAWRRSRRPAARSKSWHRSVKSGRKGRLIRLYADGPVTGQGLGARRGKGALDGLCSGTTGGQSQFLGARQGRGAEEAHLVHARRAAGLPLRHLHPAARHRSGRLGSDFQDPGRRHPRHVQHVLRRWHPPHGDLRAEHHAVHLGLDHHPVDDDGVADTRATQERGRAGPQGHQPVHPLSHRGAGGVPGLRHLDRPRRRRQRRSPIPGYVLPHLDRRSR